MAVDDHGLEVIKKSGEQVTPGSKADYYLKVGLHGTTQVPPNADAVTVTYPSSTSEVYAYRTGGVSGAIVKTITLTYVDSTKDQISSVVWS